MRELGVPLQDQAVLFRTGHHSDGLEIELSRRKIPYMKFGGLRFLEAAHVKDLMAMLRILDNPRDELAWHRVLQLIPGIGPSTARRIMTDLTETNEAPLRQFCETSFPVVAEARPFLVELQDAMGDCLAGTLDPVPRSRDSRRLPRLSLNAATTMPRSGCRSCPTTGHRKQLQRPDPVPR